MNKIVLEYLRSEMEQAKVQADSTATWIAKMEEEVQRGREQHAAAVERHQALAAAVASAHEPS